MAQKKHDSATVELAQLMSDFGSTKKILMLLTLFLSESELQTMSKRFEIFKLLSQKTSYEVIQHTLGVSSATVSAVAQLHKHPFSADVLHQLAARDWATLTARKIRDWFSSLSS
ncbi:hypothetical protein KA078_01770 [Candidatus Woesebacteria bacterium]|nr:hypothetical protein [Candidatus Woesebacteria bacterium]